VAASHTPIAAIIICRKPSSAEGSFREIDPKMLKGNFEVNVMGLLYLSREVAPDMIDRGKGAILVTGNTSSLRGKADFAGFAPTKAAQRVLAESIAREVGPLGVHVSYVLIDAVIDTPRMRARMSDKPDEFFIKPAAIADELFHLYGQDPLGLVVSHGAAAVQRKLVMLEHGHGALRSLWRALRGT